MKMPTDGPKITDLDDLFQSAGSTAPVADDAFMARVLADALREQPAAPSLAPPPRRHSLWARLAAALGGAAAVAGIGSAAMAGLVIGYVQPDAMVSLAGSIGLSSGESLELLPGFDALLTEELTQ